MRRAAAGAWRFLPGARAAAAMCEALSDPHPWVRDHAAWALRFGTDERAERVRCLTRAANAGADEQTRRTARTSLDALAATGLPAR